jgi:hypothetical protein
MMQYLLAAILLMGIPFLLYCLWNFARELRPYGSRAVVSPISSATAAHAVTKASFRTEPRVVYRLERTSSAS